MISDNEVRQRFQKLLSLPDVLTGLNRLNTNANYKSHMDSRINLQVHRGQAARFWEGAPKGGCAQCVVVFTGFDAIPKYCFDCYKILIELHNVLDLFKLLLLFERIELPRNNSRKCMIETRNISSARYKGFVYCRGLEEAKDLCQVLQGAIYDGISPDISVKVKRGCTEYTQKYPEYGQINSDKDGFEYKNEWQFYEDFVDKYWSNSGNVDCYDEDGKGTDPMREVPALQFWLRYAATVGDKTYLMLTGGKVVEPLPHQSTPPGP